MNTILHSARVKHLLGYTLFCIFCLATLSANELRVATYNIKHGAGMDGKVDLDRQIKVLKSMNPDLIALQEVDKNASRSGGVDQAQYIADKMGMHVYFGKAIPLGKGEYGQAVLSKFPLSNSKVHKLPSRGEQRIVVEATVDVPKLGKIQFCSVHYSFASEKERFPQVEKFEEVIKDSKLPIILTGDFNATPETKTMKNYAEQWQIVPKSGDKLTSPANKPRSEIDFCVIKNWKGVKAMTKVLDEPVASDHRPLLTVIKW